jgi:hypothetical protein
MVLIQVGTVSARRQRDRRPETVADRDFGVVDAVAP